MSHKTVYLNVVTVLLCCFNLLSAQNTAQQHVVVKGDNIYRLSLRYNVTMEAIFNSNPGSRSLIRIGELLDIPEQTNNISSSPTSRNNNFKNHKVLKGETKYGLSRRYNCSISDLERLNPQITKMLLTGAVISIPDSSYTKNNTNNNRALEQNTHTVTRGETLWLISQKYGISLAELKALNPQKTTNIINVGETLTVTSSSKDKSIYIVVKGDTKFGLSRRFNVTIETLERMNPNIVPMLKSGATIRVSETHITSNAVKKNTRNETYTSTTENSTTNNKASTRFIIIDYTIKPKETLYGLAKQANMTIDEFLTLNPALRDGVTKGSLIRMPVAINTPNSEDSPNEPPNNKDNNTLDISILWNDSNTIEKKSNYLVGLNKAIDSISKIYPNNSININSTKIIDPATINMFPADSLGNRLNDYSQIDFIALNQNTNNSDNNVLIKSKPTEADMRDLVLSHLKRQNKKVICIYDQNHKKNLDVIQTFFPEVEFVPTKKNGSFKSSSLKKALESNLNYAVILESDKVGVYLSTTNILLKEISDDKSIQLAVLNAENIPSETNVTSIRFSILKLLYPQIHQDSGIDKEATYSFAFNYDLFNRLFSEGLQGLDNQTTSHIGYSFTYDFKDNIFKNKAVKLYVFSKGSKRIEIKQY